MIISTLLENTTISRDYKTKHGLSLHIQINEHKILFDLGPDDTFIDNAKNLNIDIGEVDIVVISHGHRDHGGGLESFLKENSKAKIYINKNAFQPHYSKLLNFMKHYIGLNQELKNNDRIILTGDDYIIDDNLRLFSGVNGNKFILDSNKSLLMKEGDEYLQDDFKHEQNLIIKENNKHILISGCSHCGVVNIIERGEKLIRGKFNTQIGGLHLYNPISKKEESLEFIKALGKNLNDRNINYYTCHCTGIKAFNDLRKILGIKMNYLSTGKIIEI